MANDSNISPNPAPNTASHLELSRQIGVGILCVAFVLGFPGNLFVVWTVLCRMTRRSVTCLLVLNLAAADALVLLSAPIFIRSLTGRVSWEFGAGMCKSVHYLCGVNMYASIYLICLMSADRWLAVSRPFLSQRMRTKRALWGLLLGLWSLAFLLALPVPFYRSNVTLDGSVYYCIPYHWGSVGHQVFQYLMETIMGFLLPFLIIILCYTSIICWPTE
ncbi:hypothetical protein GJAV_G00155630 [Gymnothorax javanicus]|nr:hypothetical protein GJAV_G00155630 [Gymnothorax javanicus]